MLLVAQFTRFFEIADRWDRLIVGMKLIDPAAAIGFLR
jgi:hypothetical protein